MCSLKNWMRNSRQTRTTGRRFEHGRPTAYSGRDVAGHRCGALRSRRSLDEQRQGVVANGSALRRSGHGHPGPLRSQSRFPRARLRGGHFFLYRKIPRSADRTRTCDILVNSEALYQLSYRGIYCSF